MNRINPVDGTTATSAPTDKIDSNESAPVGRIEQKDELPSNMEHQSTPSHFNKMLRRRATMNDIPESKYSTPAGALSSNERRKIKRLSYINSIKNDLVEIVCDAYRLEHNMPQNEPFHGDANGIGTPSSQNENLTDHVRGFIDSLPPRYAVSVDSAGEVLIHMRLLTKLRSMVLLNNNKNKAFVHITKSDLNRRPSDQNDNPITPPFGMTFCPNSNDMNNVQLITIVCPHTVGLMAYITGLLVSGGSNILDTDYLCTPDKFMLVRCVMNMTGCFQLENLETCINAYISACTGEEYDMSKYDMDLPLVDKIGAVDPALVMPETTVAVSDCSYQEHYGRASNFYETFDSPIPFTDFLDDRSESKRNSTVKNHTNCEEMKENIIDQTISKFNSKESPPLVDERDDRAKSQADGFFSNLVLTRKVRRDNKATIDNRYVFIGNPVGESKSVAIKIATGDEIDTEILKDLRGEGDIAKNLKHKNICQLMNMSQSPSHVYLAYEYCPNGSLLSLLRSNCTYDYLSLARDISRGMAFLHSKNIIHRDLKPTNILIDEHNHAKIADFGMSIAHTGDEELLGETGTYRWMAPEIIRHDPYSVNSDIYSFGLVLWQLLTRSLCPFQELDYIQAAWAVAKDGKRPEIPDYVPDYMSRMMKACWHRDQQQRPSFAYIVIGLMQYADAVKLKRSQCR